MSQYKIVLIFIISTILLINSASAISLVPEGLIDFSGLANTTSNSSSGGQSIKGIGESGGVYTFLDNISLPIPLAEIDTINIAIYSDPIGTNITYSLFVNTATLAFNRTINNSDLYNKTDLILAGVDMNVTYLDIYVTCNNKFLIKIVLKTSAYKVMDKLKLNVIERVTSTPKITYKEPKVFAVEAIATVENPSKVDIVNLTINVQYPDSAFNQPVKKIVVDPALSPGEKKTLIIKYQKKTPYIINVTKRDVEENKRETILTVYSYEDLRAEMRLDKEILPDIENITPKNLTLKVNGQPIDFRFENKTIKAYVPLYKGKNTVEVVYTAPVISVAAPVEIVKEEKPSIIEQIVMLIVDFFKKLFGFGSVIVWLT